MLKATLKRHLSQALRSYSKSYAKRPCPNNNYNNNNNNVIINDSSKNTNSNTTTKAIIIDDREGDN